MPKDKNINLDFRPERYWDTPAAIHANIKGQSRRDQIDQAIAEGRVDEVPDLIFSDALPEEERKFRGSLHPQLMGGEYLPEYLPGEVEIARVSLDSTTGDVISVRARPDGERIRYRVVDEYGNEHEKDYGIEPEVSDQPLTLRELIHLMDTAKDPNGPTGLIEHHWDYLLGDDTPEEAAAFTTVSSRFYQVDEWYEQRAAEWIRESEAKEKELEN